MMKNTAVDILIKRNVPWLSLHNNDSVALSSRIRLARNIAGMKFPIASNDIDRDNSQKIAISAINDSGIFENPIILNLNSEVPTDRNLLLERHLISREFCEGLPFSSLIFDLSESLSIMVNEEDHFRIQVIKPGFSLNEVWEQINDSDDMISSKISYAYSNTLGYLTSCPTNVGTGMRASVMLNLPALAILGQINAVVQGAAKLGLTVRGLYGEGSESFGNLYQVSNQSTLGDSEKQIIGRVTSIIGQIINHEKNARQILLETKANFLLDCVGRSFGTLRYAHVLTSREAYHSLSALRMGVDLKMFNLLTLDKLNELFISIQDSHLKKMAGRELSQYEADIFRAEIVRKKFKEI